jgi:CRP-like cAMP-binding protein
MLERGQEATRVAEEQIKLLTLVDIFEPLSREEIEAIQWEHLNTTVERGEISYTPMDLCETLFVLQKGRIQIYRATSEGREFTVAVVESGTVFGEMVLTGQRLRNSFARPWRNPRSPQCAAPTWSASSWTSPKWACSWCTC